MRGTFVAGPDVLAFEATQLEPGVLDATIEVNNVTTLTVTIHPAKSAAALDGYNTDGKDVTLTDAEKNVLQQFAVALERPNKDFTPTDILFRGASMWASQLEGVSPKIELLSDPERGYTSLCNYVYQYAGATHDCGYGAWASPQTTRAVQIAYHGNSVNPEFCQPSGTSKAWTLTPPSYYHTPDTLPNMTSDCWSHCGAGCPGSSSNQTNTVDCMNHDICVQMHYSTSGDCINEANAASDDYFFAYSCNYTALAWDGYFGKGSCP